MSQKWTKEEENNKRTELIELYVKENKTIGEIALQLHLGQTTVYDRLVRFGIFISRMSKERYCNKRAETVIPTEYSEDLAEFIGILLGDGHITPTQVTVTLGTKDQYAPYVAKLAARIFNVAPRIMTRPRGELVVYFGSTAVVRWLIGMGLCSNKVKGQVNVPEWIFSKDIFMRAALRGLIDTDGSVYQLKSGNAQLSFSNRSTPLLRAVRMMLIRLGYNPSKVSGPRLYLTRKADLGRFYREIGFGNMKHNARFEQFFR